MIRGNYVVEKRNVLNEIRTNGLTLQEVRFFTIYLAKINARDVSTRVVRFSIDEFKNIMTLEKVNLLSVRDSIDALLCKIVGVPMESGGFRRFQLFKECVVDQDEYGDWYVEIDAHDSALPLMFDFKERYFKYELWNALRLKSVNQIRMYEVLKQYEYLGERTIDIDELRALLGVGENEYTRFNNFKIRVLDACQAALDERTDIKFTYEPIGKGRGGKVKAIKFAIQKNEYFTDSMSIFEYISEDDIKRLDDDYGDEFENEDFFAEKIYPLLSGACDDEFSCNEIRVLYNILAATPKTTGESVHDALLKMYGAIKRKYDEMRLRSSVKHRFGYLKRILESEVEF